MRGYLAMGNKMIDKAVLNELIDKHIKSDNGDKCLTDDFYSIHSDYLIHFANACAEYGKSQSQEEIEELKEKVFQLKGEIVAVNFEKKILGDSLKNCAAGEWLDYPQNMPEVGKYYIIEFNNIKHNLQDIESVTKDIFYFHHELQIDAIQNEYRKIKRFAKIN